MRWDNLQVWLMVLLNSLPINKERASTGNEIIERVSSGPLTFSATQRFFNSREGAAQMGLSGLDAPNSYMSGLRLGVKRQMRYSQPQSADFVTCPIKALVAPFLDRLPLWQDAHSCVCAGIRNWSAGKANWPDFRRVSQSVFWQTKSRPITDA